MVAIRSQLALKQAIFLKDTIYNCTCPC